MPRPTPLARAVASKRGATWILVADAGRARLFETRWNNGELFEIDDCINAQVRVGDAALVSDRPGSSSHGADGRTHAFESHERPMQHAEEAFARELCGRLARARQRGEVSRLYLLADPAFLGRLRQHLDRPTQRIVVQEMATDLTRRSPEIIRKALPRTL